MTGELVERGTYQAYGVTESDYRPGRWEHFREDYKFTGKEEDVEVGLQYFGKRFLSAHLQRWVTADPLAVHAPGAADLNLYAYVRGRALKAVDPAGLCDSENSSCPATASVASGAVQHGGGSQTTVVNHTKAPAPPRASPKAAKVPSSGAGGTAADMSQTEAQFNSLKAASDALLILHDYEIRIEHEVMPEGAERAQAYGGSQGGGATDTLPSVPRLMLHVGTVEPNVRMAAAPNARSLLGRSAASPVRPIPGVGKPFRAPNPAHPPNQAASKRMRTMKTCESRDCSEIAEELQAATGGQGRILEVAPAAGRTLRVPEFGKIESDFVYHQVYTDGRYVFDPRLTTTPVPKGDWKSMMKGLNPGMRFVKPNSTFP